MNIYILIVLFISGVVASPPDDLPYITWKLAEAINSLAFKLHYHIAITNPGNFVISPVSIANALGMLNFGAKGRTAKELEQFIGYETANATRSLASKAFRHVMTELLVTSKPKRYTVDIGGTLFINQPTGVSPTYLRRVEEFFRTPVKHVSFLLEGEKAVSEFNEYAKKKSKNKIDKAIEKLDLNSHIVSVSIAYLKGAWRWPFSSNRTKPGIFYNNGEHETSVPMMEGEGQFYYGRFPQMSIIELPIKGRNLSALFVLPHERDGLPKVERSSGEHTFSQYLQRMEDENVAVRLPKFKINFSTELSETMKFFGVTQLFDRDSVNLSGMIPRNDVVMGNVLHSAVIEVSESGIETTSSKIVPPVDYDDMEEFYADHPFLFGIVDIRNGMILFMGRVETL